MGQLVDESSVSTCREFDRGHFGALEATGRVPLGSAVVFTEAIWNRTQLAEVDASAGIWIAVELRAVYFTYTALAKLAFLVHVSQERSLIFH